VLALVAEGRTNRQIGQALYITPKTASAHLSRILTKLGIAGRGEAATVAHRLGLDNDDPLGRGRSTRVMRSTIAVRQRRASRTWAQWTANVLVREHTAAEEGEPPVNFR
jgi:hypothetical protein